MQPFILYRQDHASDRFSSLAFCTKNTVEAMEHEYFNEIKALKFVPSYSTTPARRTILLLYRKPSTNVLNYLGCLRNILNTNSVDMILGDFNLNYFDESSMKPLKSLMDALNYTQMIQSPTFVSSGIL